jgi:hypothetical protein
MWCSHCQQDVPAFASPKSESKVRCARCGDVLSMRASNSAAKTADISEAYECEPDAADAAATSARVASTATASRPPITFDDWEFDEDLRAVDRLVRSLNVVGQATSADDDSLSLLPDGMHRTLPNWHAHLAANPAANPAATGSQHKQPPRAKRSRRSPFFSWTILLLGLMTFVCGTVLLGWSLLEGRDDLWNLGMPLALVGQVALLVSLIFQLDGLWQSNRETVSTLDKLDDQVHNLRHATTLLSGSHSTPGQSFYVHMADGASPQLLLADLKGQLDLLSVKLSDERR